MLTLFIARAELRVVMRAAIEDEIEVRNGALNRWITVLSSDAVIDATALQENIPTLTDDAFDKMESLLFDTAP